MLSGGWCLALGVWWLVFSLGCLLADVLVLGSRWLLVSLGCSVIGVLVLGQPVAGVESWVVGSRC